MMEPVRPSCLAPRGRGGSECSFSKTRLGTAIRAFIIQGTAIGTPIETLPPGGRGPLSNEKVRVKMSDP